MENDNQMKEAILQQLKDHPRIDTTHITVEVVDATVFLKGRADTKEEKKWAEEIAQAFPGVREVKNELHIGTGIVHAITSIVSGLSASNEHDLHKDKPPEQKE